MSPKSFKICCKSWFWLFFALQKQKHSPINPDKIWHIGIHRGWTPACLILAMISDKWGHKNPKFNKKAVLSQRWPAWCVDKYKQPHLHLRSRNSRLSWLNSTRRYGSRCWTNIFSQKFLCSSGSRWMTFGLQRAKSAISFQDFQPVWSWSTNVTDRWTDDMRLQDCVLHYSASHGKTGQIAFLW